MARPALLSDIGGFSDSEIDLSDCCVNVPVNGYSRRRRFPEYMKLLLQRPPSPSDDDDDDEDDDDEDDDHSIEMVSLEDQLGSHLLHDEYRWEPIGSHLTRQYYYYSAPVYFKRDHPDDDLFLKQLGDAQLPWTTQLKNYPKHADEPLIKDVMAFIIWQDTRDDTFWKSLRKLSPPDQDDSLYSKVIQGAAFLVSFLHTQANLFKIGRERTLKKQMDIIFTDAVEWAKKGTPIDEACKLLIQLTADNDDFSFVTENDLADMLCYYAIDIRFKDFQRPPTVRDPFPPTVKDQLLEDITRVLRKVELSPTELKADEYTHWMMMLLREEATQVEENLISEAIGDNPMVKLARPSEDNNPMIKQGRPSEDNFMDDLFTFLLRLLTNVKDRMKLELANVVQPLDELCKLHRCKICPEISETIQVAYLRRMSLGSRFIGRSHLIWAFYKLGYALPLEIRNMINIFDSDEDHPPYHIYMAALKLALQSGEKRMQLDHFIYAVLNSKDIDFDGEQWTEFSQDFKDFQQGLESMESEIEPKSTVTVRPCGSLDIFCDSRDSHNTEERTTNVEPKSSENLSTESGDAEDSITNTGRIYLT
ncbi:uncharacterized protein LOC141606106 [Silene latifolia]|uniref:uncharacterized protein LOC141606106 n=1 Tax=Silene latifolia TaxID=37657 RepID=UPI003D77F69E